MKILSKNGSLLKSSDKKRTKASMKQADVFKVKTLRTYLINI